MHGQPRERDIDAIPGSPPDAPPAARRSPPRRAPATLPRARRYGPRVLPLQVRLDSRPARYDKIAEALGCYAEYVEQPEEIRSSLLRAWKKVEEGMAGFVNVKTD